MANLNKVFLMGNLTRDPELRYTPSGTPVCEFGLAVNRRFTTRDGEQRDETLFVEVTMWGRRGVAISEYFSKGRPIFIEGRLKYDSWETADGRRTKISVVAENFQFLGRPGAAPEGQQAGGAQSERTGSKKERGSGGSQPRSAEESPPKEREQEGFDVSDDEIPF